MRTLKGRARRRIQRGAFAGAVVSLALALVPAGPVRAQEPPPTEDEVALPDAFTAAASAAALEVQLLTPPFVPVPDLFQFRVAEGRGTYSGSNQEARSSTFFPGSGAIAGPGLACGQARSQFPPESEPLFGPIFDACVAYKYPFTVFADSLNPSRQTEGAVALGTQKDPISLQAAGARAHAGIDATTTDADVSDLRVIGAPAVGSLKGLLTLAGLDPADATVITADGITAVTDQRIVGDALVTVSKATVTGLRLLGGLVRVGSIVSRSSLTSQPGEEPVVAADLEVQGVEVAGTPAQLTEDGLVLAGAPSGPIAQQIASQAAALLHDRGMRMTLLPVEEGEIDGIPAASAAGILIEFSTPISGLPPIPGPLGDSDINGDYGVRLILGTTGVRGFAENFGSNPLVRPPAGPPGGTLGGGFMPPPGSVPTLPAATGVPGSGADVGGAGTVPVASPEPIGFLGDLFADRVGLLYLSFTLAAVGLCVAPRLTLPARLPRGA